MKLVKKLLLKYFENLVYFYKHLHYRLFIMIFLGVIVGVLDGLGLAMFMPLLEMVNNPLCIFDSDYLLLNIYRSVYDDNESRVVVGINSSINNLKRSQTSVCDIEDKEKLSKLIPKGEDRNFIIKTIY